MELQNVLQQRRSIRKYKQQPVEKEKIQTDFINLEEGHSRINVKILEDEKETAINSKGPLVDNKSIEKLYQKLSNLKENDILVLSGSIPKGIKEEIYEEICEKIKDKKLKYSKLADRAIIDLKNSIKIKDI